METKLEPMTKQQILATGMLRKYGISRQLNKAQEECAELIVAIAKYSELLGELGAAHRVREEIADVTIMLEQLRILFGPEQCDEALENKIAKVAKKHGIK